LSSGPMKASLNDESLVKIREAMLIARSCLHENAVQVIRGTISIAAHIFSCQYVNKSSWQDEGKVFREDEGTTSVVLDKQKRLGFAELAGVWLCSFFPKLRLKTKGKCKSSTVVTRILCKHDLDYTFQIFQIHSDISSLYLARLRKCLINTEFC